jgi:hypothetical protein
MVLNPRASGCVKVYADLLRKTIRLLTNGDKEGEVYLKLRLTLY